MREWGREEGRERHTPHSCYTPLHSPPLLATPAPPDILTAGLPTPCSGEPNVLPVPLLEGDPGDGLGDEEEEEAAGWNVSVALRGLG